MYTERIPLEKSVRCAKFSVGPMDPNPGPTFPRQVTTEDRDVIRLSFSNEIKNVPANTIRMYRKKWFAIELTVSPCSVLPSSFTVSITLG